MAEPRSARPSLLPRPAAVDPLLYWLLALALVRGLIYASLVPPWQAPDEPAQFERAKAALNGRDWNSTSETGPAWYDDLVRSLYAFNYWDFVDDDRPVYSPDSLLNEYIAPYHEIYGGLYGSRLTYGLLGWPLVLAPGQDLALQLYLVRLYTVLMNLGIILLAYLMVREIFPGNRFLLLGVPILILFNPQHTHMLSTVNNGNLAELLATAALYFLIRGVMRGFTWPALLASLGLAVLAMWTKATAYFLAPALASIGLFYIWAYRRYWRWLLAAAAASAVVFYFLMPARLSQLLTWGWGSLLAGQFYLDPLVPRDLFDSFWAMPGWFMVRLYPAWYRLLAAACAVAVAGLVIGLATRWKPVLSGRHQAQAQALVVLAVAVLAAVGTLLAWHIVTGTIVYRQGRSIYPVIAPVALFLMLGWQQLIPAGWRWPGLLAITGGLALFDSLVLFNYVIPVFYSRF